MEPVAAAKFIAVTGNDVLPCGFVVNRTAPHLGASPDRRVVDQSEDPRCGLKEIKCPDKNACKDCPYLIQNADEDLALKVDHMGITGAK